MMLYQPGKSASSMILLDQRQGDRLSGVSPPLSRLSKAQVHHQRPMMTAKILL